MVQLYNGVVEFVKFHHTSSAGSIERGIDSQYLHVGLILLDQTQRLGYVWGVDVHQTLNPDRPALVDWAARQYPALDGRRGGYRLGPGLEHMVCVDHILQRFGDRLRYDPDQAVVACHLLLVDVLDLLLCLPGLERDRVAAPPGDAGLVEHRVQLGPLHPEALDQLAG